MAYLEELIAAGSYIGMDRFGIEPILPFEDRVATVATMCERGHADRMVLSHDAACHNAWMGDEIVATATPSWHYLHISHDVIPALRARGVTDEQFDQMLVHNPRAIFERRTRPNPPSAPPRLRAPTSAASAGTPARATRSSRLQRCGRSCP